MKLTNFGTNKVKLSTHTTFLKRRTENSKKKNKKYKKVPKKFSKLLYYYFFLYTHAKLHYGCQNWVHKWLRLNSEFREPIIFQNCLSCGSKTAHNTSSSLFRNCEAIFIMQKWTRYGGEEFWSQEWYIIASNVSQLIRFLSPNLKEPLNVRLALRNISTLILRCVSPQLVNALHTCKTMLKHTDFFIVYGNW